MKEGTKVVLVKPEAVGCVLGCCRIVIVIVIVIVVLRGEDRIDIIRLEEVGVNVERSYDEGFSLCVKLCGRIVCGEDFQ